MHCGGLDDTNILSWEWKRTNCAQTAEFLNKWLAVNLMSLSELHSPHYFFWTSDFKTKGKVTRTIGFDRQVVLGRQRHRVTQEHQFFDQVGEMEVGVIRSRRYNQKSEILRHYSLVSTSLFAPTEGVLPSILVSPWSIPNSITLNLQISVIETTIKSRSSGAPLGKATIGESSHVPDTWKRTGFSRI